MPHPAPHRPRLRFRLIPSAATLLRPALVALLLGGGAACLPASRPSQPSQPSEPSQPAGNPRSPFDIVIVGGHILDGTGSPWYAAQIGVRAGHIAAIGKLDGQPRRQTIDAHGQIVAPGFIDMLGQSELNLLVDPRVPSKIFQGITTEITGEGDSVAPLNPTLIADNQSDYQHLGIHPDWTTLAQYFARLEHQGIGINFATYVGETGIRRIVLGDGDVQPTPAQLDQMRALVRQAMLDGAMGLSTSLQYAPAPYAKTSEIAALASVAAQYGGIYATHVRSEGDAILPALDEAAAIGRQAHASVEIWHLKAAGRANWGRMPQIVAHIEQLRASGLDIAADTYAYTAWGNPLSAFIPPWAHAGGTAAMLQRLRDPAQRARIRTDLLQTHSNCDNEWQEISGPGDILITDVSNPALRPLLGQRLAAIATQWHKDPIDALCDLLLQDQGNTEAAVFAMSEPDVELALKQPWVSVDNDAGGVSPEGILGQQHTHPRAYGTFPRILRKYVRQQQLLTLPDAIRKFSALPAQRLRLGDRGVLKLGMAADIVIFDPATIQDHATYENPNQLSTGMDFVLVNGVPVIAHGSMTGALPGQVLRGPGYRR